MRAARARARSTGWAVASIVIALLASARQAASQATGAPAFERRITLHVKDVALRDALDRIALAARIRLSYSGDNLPLDRRVVVSRDSSAVIDVLSELLRPYPVQPVALASDHIVLAPREAAPADSVAGSVAMLDRVVVTGSVIAAPERPLPVALDIVRGRDIERRDESEIAHVLTGSVPGMWVWEQSPTAMIARYGSIRGASSFGLSSPKVYIDGIEVANPLLLRQMTPELIDRVEVIRGPQGAALYGADAISGVVNIISRHEGTRSDGTHALLRTAGGFSASTYTSSPVPAQDHSLSLRGGSNVRSGGITVGGSGTGEYIPQGYSREIRTVADGRVIGARTSLSANARFYAKDAGVPANPLLSALKPEVFRADSVPQQLRMYSLGSTVTTTPRETWTYTITTGLDGYRLNNVSNENVPIPALVDTALRDARGSAVRGTMRGSAVRSFGAPETMGATVTFSAEQTILREKTLQQAITSSGSGPSAPTALRDEVQFIGTTGMTAQASLALHNALFVSGGLRRESIGQSDAPAQGGLLPMLGAAWVRDRGPVTMKLRAAYGKGIRGSRSTIHVGTREPKRTLFNRNLEAEEQAGIEAGGDLLFGRRVGLHVTRFDQLASGLIQTVLIRDPYDDDTTRMGEHHSWYQLQNVGQIVNRGWEGQATVSVGALSLSGAAALVESRVRRIAPTYTGDLLPGDRMFGVPSRTFSGTMAWSRPGLQLSSTISRANDWVNYDRLSIAQDLIAAGGDARGFTGANLRKYWVIYPGATRLRASAVLDVWRGMSLSLTGENLLNYQRGEPDTITIVPGRTVLMGLKARF